MQLKLKLTICKNKAKNKKIKLKEKIILLEKNLSDSEKQIDNLNNII